MSKRPQNTSSRFVLNASSSVLTMLISMTALLWVNQYLLRRISPEEYALVPILTSLMVFAEFFRIIFTRGLSRFMVAADAKDDHTEVSRIVSSMIPVLGAVALFLGLAGGLVVVYIDQLIKVEPTYLDDARIMMSLLVLTLCISIVTTPLCAGLYVRMRFVELNLVKLGTEVFRVIVLMWLLVAIGPQALWVVVASSSANILNFLVMSIYTFRILPSARFHKALVSVRTMRRLLSFSLWTSVQGLNMFVQRALPALLLNRFSTGVDVAAFYVGNLPNQQIRKLTQAAAGPATPALTAIYATEGEEALQKYYYQGGRYHLWGTLFLLPPLIIFARDLILLYVGATYLDAATVMIVLLIIYPFHWASAMFYQIAYATEKIQAFNVTSIGLALTAGAAMYYFVALRDMGAVGAAYGMATGFILTQVLLIWPMGLRLVKGSWKVFILRTIIPGAIPFLGAVVLCTLYGQVLGVDSWLKFFGGCGVSAIGYIAILIVFCLGADDRAVLKDIKGKLRKRTR